MQVYKELGLDIDKREVISFVGGGGKTTTLFKLAEELKLLKKKVLVTTTTAILNPTKQEYDYHFMGRLEDFSPMGGSITVYGERVEGRKLFGLTLSKAEEVTQKGIFDFVLIEADGAKRKPIKGHAPYEPVIPKNNTKTIGIIGLDALSKRIQDIVHRPEIFMRITDSQNDDIIDEEIIVRYILNPKGIFKGAVGERILLLNKAYDDSIILTANTIRHSLYAEGYKGIVLVSDVKSNMFY